MQEYFKKRLAECGGHALLFVTLCREAGIPARRVFTPVFESPDIYTLGSHETSEFYTKEHGWIPIDNTTENECGIQYEILTLWRKNYLDPKKILSPELKNITVTYKNRQGKQIVLKGR